MSCISTSNSLLFSFHETVPHIPSVGSYRSCGHSIKCRPIRVLYLRVRSVKQNVIVLAHLPAPSPHLHTAMHTHMYSHAHIYTHMCTYTGAPKHARLELLAICHEKKPPESGWKSRGHILMTFLALLKTNTTCLTSTWTGWLPSTPWSQLLKVGYKASGFKT